MSGTTSDAGDYATHYPRHWKSPIFNPPRSFWNDSYGLALNSHPAGKIVVFGLPKSGNVWVKSLIVDYFQIAPVEPILDVAKPGAGITHRPFDRHIGMREDFLHGVCIIRDPRDLVSSFYKYTQTHRFRSARPEFHYDDVRSFYYDWFLSRSVGAHKFLTHSEEYARLGVPILRYEELRKNGARELERLLLRWGFAPDQKRIAAALAENDIDKLRSEGKQLEKPISSEHFRAGGVGTYADVLPDEIIKDIEERFERILLRWGYTLRQ